MRKKIFFGTLLLLSTVLLFSCSHKVAPNGTAPGVSSKGQGISSPACIVYKTRADYSRNVPVILDEKKSKITSYPDIRDLSFKGKLAYPTELSEGYLLDNRGIGTGVAFLKYTYEAYQQLEKTPSMDQLMEQILDKDPLTEMYECKARDQYQDIENELNKLIISGKLNSCKRIK